MSTNNENNTVKVVLFTDNLMHTGPSVVATKGDSAALNELEISVNETINLGLGLESTNYDSETRTLEIKDFRDRRDLGFKDCSQDLEVTGNFY
ncbi:hypothetical protein AYI70_g6383 [Smittium culicis]|uniref:Uncharacterized protein n=1 Tax=Smittium culicis TaxID=133412 RepID=A0A1R1XQ68_9FUNG|nr:hypothetical protein AYI70_g6383 [Smittium culicis]